MKKIISVENVSKFYRKGTKALEDVSMEIYENEIVGLIGPNGAGKTTIMKLILGLLFPDTGKIKIYGKSLLNNPSLKALIGYLPENPSFPAFMTGRDFLLFHGYLYGLDEKILMKRVREVLKLVKMEEEGNKKLTKYSKGMVQRIFLAQAILNKPKILFLDEPTTGLDPEGVMDFRRIILSLKKEGTTIMINSHRLSELEKICDRFLFLKKGKIEKIIYPNEYTEGAKQAIISIKNLTSKLLESLSEFKFEKEDDKFKFLIKSDEELTEIIKKIIENDGLISLVETKTKTLEDIFVELLRGKE